MNEFSLFDFLDDEEAKKYKPQKSTDWKWTMANAYPKEKNGLKVFSCFACGGGSTMGYKLAGCEVLGCCEIDPKMNEVYVKNHNPKHNFLMDIREFNALPNEEIPPELFDLDILDGSPPCTTFSMAGEREEGWGKKKKFREGQQEQTLDDLSFAFIDTVRKLKPKVVIMENVEGLLLGEAWAYVQRIYKELNEAGYAVHHWLLKGENMGVPQTRHRVFFVAVQARLDIDPQMLDMSFNYEPVTYRQIQAPGERGRIKPCLAELVPLVKCGDRTFSNACERKKGKAGFFNEMICYPDKIMPTIRTYPTYYRYGTWDRVNAAEYVACSTFPTDYDFINNGETNVCYMCGMSVPPIMIKRIVTRLIEQGVFDYKNKEETNDA